jgi:hypothetical protein
MLAGAFRCASRNARRHARASASAEAFSAEAARFSSSSSPLLHRIPEEVPFRRRLVRWSAVGARSFASSVASSSSSSSSSPPPPTRSIAYVPRYKRDSRRPNANPRPSAGAGGGEGEGEGSTPARLTARARRRSAKERAAAVDVPKISRTAPDVVDDDGIDGGGEMGKRRAKKAPGAGYEVCARDGRVHDARGGELGRKQVGGDAYAQVVALGVDAGEDTSPGVLIFTNRRRCAARRTRSAPRLNPLNPLNPKHLTLNNERLAARRVAGTSSTSARGFSGFASNTASRCGNWNACF